MEISVGHIVAHRAPSTEVKLLCWPESRETNLSHDRPAKTRDVALGHRGKPAIQWQKLSVAYHPPLE
jgi:hypothetical protein